MAGCGKSFGHLLGIAKLYVCLASFAAKWVELMKRSGKNTYLGLVSQ